jgi:hypothetical protein
VVIRRFFSVRIMQWFGSLSLYMNIILVSLFMLWGWWGRRMVRGRFTVRHISTILAWIVVGILCIASPIAGSRWRWLMIVIITMMIVSMM